LVEHLLCRDRRVLLFGEAGSGKSTLAAQLAADLERV
jgi:adenylate kinase family enzyme